MLTTAIRKAGYAVDDPQVHNLRIGTIHSLCDGLLAEFDNAYMAAGTQLIDEPECVARLVRAELFGENPGIEERPEMHNDDAFALGILVPV